MRNNLSVNGDSASLRKHLKNSWMVYHTVVWQFTHTGMYSMHWQKELQVVAVAVVLFFVQLHVEILTSDSESTKKCYKKEATVQFSQSRFFCKYMEYAEVNHWSWATPWKIAVPDQRRPNAERNLFSWKRNLGAITGMKGQRKYFQEGY